MSTLHHTSEVNESSLLAILLLVVGTVASAAAGRVFYQIALTETHNDNGFVTMFFLLAPVMSTHIDPAFMVNPKFARNRQPLVLLGHGARHSSAGRVSLKSLRTLARPEDSPAEAP
jgi:hypothetical protein